MSLFSHTQSLSLSLPLSLSLSLFSLYLLYVSLSKQQAVHVRMSSFAEEKSSGVGELVSYATGNRKKYIVSVKKLKGLIMSVKN